MGPRGRILRWESWGRKCLCKRFLLTPGKQAIHGLARPPCTAGCLRSQGFDSLSRQQRHAGMRLGSDYGPFPHPHDVSVAESCKTPGRVGSPQARVPYKTLDCLSVLMGCARLNLSPMYLWFILKFSLYSINLFNLWRKYLCYYFACQFPLQTVVRGANHIILCARWIHVYLRFRALWCESCLVVFANHTYYNEAYWIPFHSKRV